VLGIDAIVAQCGVQASKQISAAVVRRYAAVLGGQMSSRIQAAVRTAPPKL
jgi:hypothetical protein